MITSDDGSLKLSAAKVTLALAKTKDKQTIATVEATGSIRLRYVQGPGQTLEAVAGKAVVRPSQQRADLIGNVVVKRWDKAKFTGPVELSGDTVTLYLKDGRVVASSNPAKSRLSASPK